MIDTITTSYILIYFIQGIAQKLKLKIIMFMLNHVEAWCVDIAFANGNSLDRLNMDNYGAGIKSKDDIWSEIARTSRLFNIMDLGDPW